MKKIGILLILAFVTLNVMAQTWVGVTTRDVNFREGPSVDYDIIRRLPKNTALFINSEDEVNGFYLAVDIENDVEGYVSKNFVKHYKTIEKAKGASIQSVGSSTSYNPDIEIQNNTDVSMTLRINTQTYKFSPHEKRTITISPGRFTYRASSPGVIPVSGSYNAESNNSYQWVFFITTGRR